jgi:nitronate monooxygenase
VPKSRFYITSLGSPEETIKAAHKVGIKVFVMLPTCLLPKKESLGADALIAVNNLAGGHREILLLKH